MAQFAPQSVSSMTPAEKKDYQEQVEWAHKVSRFLAHPVSGDSLDSCRNQVPACLTIYIISV
jgi:hypothetical protein